MAEPKLQVPVVVGTRPEAIKLVSLILALRASEHYNPIVVSTGQHNRLVEYIFELAEIKPDVTLWAGSRRAHLNERVDGAAAARSRGLGEDGARADRGRGGRSGGRRRGRRGGG
ncbi:MAG TPA: hypothetical protein VGI17_08700 [Solirubrobacterales bacterium]|jgi:UDP-N-acetylglucosamine 2-epimerase